MEWVETTGSSVDEAKDLALDRLGVAEADAEFEVLEEPRAGLFGRLRGEARIRARVRPQAPPPKIDRRDRRRRRRDSAPAGGEGGPPASEAGEIDADAGVGGGGAGAPSRRRGGRGQGTRARQPAADGGGTMDERPTIDPEEQAAALREFLDGLLEAFDATGDVASTITDEGDIELTLNGEDLGLLIGPRGQTLTALQELTRTVSQRIAAGGGGARVRVDVNGYRERRREALARFATQVAQQVRDSGEPKALEPMGPADRKVVHDTVNDITGVTTSSEGEDDDRHVVILPES